MSPTSAYPRRAVLQSAGLLTAAALLPGRAWAATSEEGDPWSRVPGILAKINPPGFPDRRFVITDYDAIGDGETDCTRAFRDAIADCHAAGGGHVVVPEGRFLTGAVHLLSNVDLHVVKNGVIAFSTDPADYLPVVFTRWEGTECYNYSPFIYAYGKRNVAVTGAGTLDGQALDGPWESWYTTSDRQGPDQRLLREMGHNGVPVSERVFGEGHYLRPNMIQFYRCENVLLRGLTILEPAMWTVHPVLSTNVTVRDVTVVSNLYNTDGCDPEASSYVHITGCRFNTNDDCVAVKAGRDEDGHRVGAPSEKIVVQNCLFSGRWGGLTVGSEMSGGVRDIFAERCEGNAPEFPGHHRLKYPLYIKANKRRGGYIDGVYLRNIRSWDIERDPIFINGNYNSESGVHPVAIRDIRVDRMTVDGFDRYALNLVGLETDPIDGVHLSRCEFTGAAGPLIVQNTDNLTFRKVIINGVEFPVKNPVAVYAEAESGEVTAPMLVLIDPLASGGAYVTVEQGHRSVSEPPPAGHAAITVDIPAAGGYSLWGRVIAPTDEDDSFWIRADDGEWTSWNNITPGSLWHWAPAPAGYHLSEGRHTITFAYREDGTHLDKIVLSNDPLFHPAEES